MGQQHRSQTEQSPLEVEQQAVTDEELQFLRSRATELLLKEDWKEYINLYSHFISLHQHHHHSQSALPTTAAAKNARPLCLAFSNRAEALHRLGQLRSALDDCDAALALDPSHKKTLLCKGKILLDLDRYASASVCLRRALGAQASSTASDAVRGLVDRCRRLETQSRTGGLDISDWVLSGFHGEQPEIAEYVGPVEIRGSENGGSGGRGLFASKNVQAGAPLLVTKAVVIGRGILPEGNSSGQEGRLVVWKDFVDKFLDVVGKCDRTLQLIYTLSGGGEDRVLPIPDMDLFKQEEEEQGKESRNERPDTDRILKILDVNCLMEEAVSAKVLGRRGDGHCGVGLWVLASFVNHSCCQNARRVHIGDYVVIHASRDIKAGEELTFAYFDTLQLLEKRRESAKGWGFQCRCERCSFEEGLQELRELESIADGGELVVRLEEVLSKKKGMTERSKGYLRASYWGKYEELFGSERLMRKWGKRLPKEVAVAESLVGAVGGDERVLKALVDGAMKGRRGGSGGDQAMMERVARVGRGVYGKVVRKKQAMRALLEELCIADS